MWTRHCHANPAKNIVLHLGLQWLLGKSEASIKFWQISYVEGYFLAVSTLCREYLPWKSSSTNSFQNFVKATEMCCSWNNGARLTWMRHYTKGFCCKNIFSFTWPLALKNFCKTSTFTFSVPGSARIILAVPEKGWKVTTRVVKRCLRVAKNFDDFEGKPGESIMH